MRLIDESEYQERLAKIPMEERTFRKAVEVAEDMPTIEAEPVKHGRWVRKVESKLDEHTGEYWEEEYCSCPFCGKDSDWEHNYCPNCGAKMDGDGNG